MIRTKYYKDLDHNYLIIITEMRKAAADYQHRMLTQNRMKKLLPCKIRYVNEECHFYYDISSKQNLKNAFDKQNMSSVHVYHLLEGMREAHKELENFLLDSRCLLLCPEYIYVEPETEEYFYIYYPYYIEEMNDSMKQTLLAEFLVEKADHEEEKGVAAVYKIYEMIQDDKFILSEAIGLFEKEEKRQEAAEPKDTREYREYRESRTHREQETEITADVTENVYGEDTYPYYEQEKTDFRGTAVAGVLSLIALAAAAAVWSIGYFYTLTAEERLVSVAGIIVLVMISALFLVYFLFHFLKYRTGRTEERETGKREMAEEELIQIPKKAELTEPKEEVYGNTVFLEASVKKTENKLYGMNKGNKYHIDLSNLPCTVGKMAGRVDVVINDKTISRLHARIWKEKESIYVTDLNSTNGTFKNGLRVDPNETVLIEPGDELRFGGMTFCYR